MAEYSEYPDIFLVHTVPMGHISPTRSQNVAITGLYKPFPMKVYKSSGKKKKK